jgi:hypothetical protein
MVIAPSKAGAPSEAGKKRAKAPSDEITAPSDERRVRAPSEVPLAAAKGPIELKAPSEATKREEGPSTRIVVKLTPVSPSG